MSLQSTQAPHAVVMIRPHHCRVNPETAADNAFQQDNTEMNQAELARSAYDEPMVFEAEDDNGVAIYHTNVLMCIGTSFVLICLDMVKDPQRRDKMVRCTLAGVHLTPQSTNHWSRF